MSAAGERQPAARGPMAALDAVIVGAGFAGMYMLHRLRGAGLCGARARGRQRRRRHLVLEPLSGRALRRGERAVLLPVRRCAAAGVGVDRALRRAARDPALRQPRGRPLRPAPRHPVQHARAAPPRSTRRTARWTVETEARRALLGQVLHHGDGLPLLAQPARVRGPRQLQGRALPHRQLAARGGRLHGQARGDHRHRLLGRAVDPHHRRPGQAPHRVPAHAQLRGAGAQRAARPRVRAGRQGGLSGACGRAPSRP